MNILIGIGSVLAALAVLSLPGLLLAFIASRIAKKKFFNVATPILIVSTLILILAAIAIPDFLKFCAKAKQSEAKTNLGALYTVQTNYRQEHGVYAGGPDAFKVLNWEPAGQNMYAYFCGGDFMPNTKSDVIVEDMKNWLPAARPYSTPTKFVCIAVGNVDNDPDLDVWTIDDAKVLVNQMNDI